LALEYSAGRWTGGRCYSSVGKLATVGIEPDFNSKEGYTPMALYEIQADKLSAVPTTTFAVEAILERKHLQKMLRADTSPLGEELLVLDEEYGNWEDSSRRIDLLCLDKDATLVVVEIKRTEDGGHIELQAIRYAAMVSSMTLDQAVAARAKSLGGDPAEAEVAARNTVTEFLGLDSIEDTELVDDVRIILVSADFSTEITTSVMWLNKRGLDIRCIRLCPYNMNGKVLVDATQIIPLPEAAEYEVKLREQTKETKKLRTKRQEIFKRFWSQFIEVSSKRTDLYKNRSTTTDHWLNAGIGRAGFTLTASLTEDRARVECTIRMGTDSAASNKAAFNALKAQKDLIHAAFGSELDWYEMPGKSSCRICKDFPTGGWKSPEEEWKSIQDWLTDNSILMEKALKAPIQSLKL
jgi:hypothetical protein